ncbi:MAG: PhaM family polyhydroxyalkanoate granule multifunctional regulatory protein, partial [Burkholderiales bacterium]
DPAELEKRIEELRTVQFWLEQNAKMMGATIQALEVQRMTLSTLKTMNVQMDGLRESLQIRMPAAAPAASPSPVVAPAPVAEPPPEAKPATDAAAPGVVDPMQWWGALTKQFTELATTAMKDSGKATSLSAAPAQAAPKKAAPKKAAARKKAAPRR